MKKRKICIIGFGRFGKLLTDILAPHGEINIISRRKIRGVKIMQSSFANIIYPHSVHNTVSSADLHLI